jgi:hypothetical protein
MLRSKWMVLAGLLSAATMQSPALAQFTLIQPGGDNRFISAQAIVSSDGQSSNQGPITRTGPGSGSLWEVSNDVGVIAQSPRAGASVAVLQTGSFTRSQIRAQGNVSSSATIGAGAITPSVFARGEAFCQYTCSAPAGQRIQVVSSRVGSGTVTITRADTGAVLFEGSGVATFAAPIGELRLTARVLAVIDVSAGPTAASAGGAFSVTLTNLDALACQDIDFNNDGIFPDSCDLTDWLCVFAGGDCCCSGCPNGADSLDFNADGVFPDSDDLDAFLRVLAGGEC